MSALNSEVKLFVLDGDPSLKKAWLLRAIPELGWRNVSELVDAGKEIYIPVVVRPK